MKKAAIIGCGGIGEYHLSHLITFNDIEITGFCDIIPERAEEFVKRASGANGANAKAYTDFRDLYEEAKPDMVFICVPPYCHGDIEFEAIKRGIHMFVEKPMSLDLEQAKAIQSAVNAKGLITAVGFQCRYDNINEAAFKYIQNYPVVTASVSRVGGIPSTPWWFDKALSGGQLVEQTIHQIDLLRYFFGEAETVYSTARRGIVTNDECPGYDTDDVTNTLITFANGMTCTVMTGCYSLNGASWDSDMVFGSRASRMIYRLTRSTTIFGLAKEDIAAEIEGVIKGDGMQRRNENEVGITVKNDTDFGTVCDRTFIDAVITGDPGKIRSPYSDALKTLELVLACNKSMETGLPVKVNVLT